MTLAPCWVCQRPDAVYLDAPLHADLRTGCAACCAWLGQTMPPWVDRQGHFWWLDVREVDAPIATLHMTLSTGVEQPEFATHRLRCAGAAPLILREARQSVFPRLVLVSVQPGDWRYPLSGGVMGGGKPC